MTQSAQQILERLRSLQRKDLLHSNSLLIDDLLQKELFEISFHLG
ncbi:hypothetical protein D515_04527 [Grimontia indica]|uniref:Uncharacterized protein n=1 Tax=Grimontia indica TaxID=1056512 RepID=R1IIA3_9GAMM|nr:hypothetical protein D515_04527 [Grimontia indica]